MGEIGDFLGIQVSMLNDEFAVSSIGKVDIYNYFEPKPLDKEREPLHCYERGGFGSSLDFNNDIVVGALMLRWGSCIHLQKGCGRVQVNTLSPASTAGKMLNLGSLLLSMKKHSCCVAAPFDVHEMIRSCIHLPISR